MSRVYFCLARRLLMTTPLRIALFIDAQNAYRRARDRFFPNPQSNVDGQFPDQAGPVDREQRRPRRPALLPVRCAYLLRSAGPEQGQALT